MKYTLINQLNHFTHSIYKPGKYKLIIIKRILIMIYICQNMNENNENDRNGNEMNEIVQLHI